MTEKLKTRSEVLKELRKFKKTMSPLVGSFEHVEIWGGDKIRIDYFTLAVVHEDGTTIWYSEKVKFAPDPDTKIQALEKAQKLQMDKTSDETVKDCSITNGMKYYVVDWVTKIDKWNHLEKFPFADPAPISEFITDEPPPEGISIIDTHGRHFLSKGRFKGISKILLVSGVKGEEWNVRKYKSLTTPHRSKDWED